MPFVYALTHTQLVLCSANMQLIKKYANRKLYHTNEKRYITLDGIANLIQAGEHIQVLDNETGEDITVTVLAQVVLQAREQGGGLLSATVLMSLIQLGGVVSTAVVPRRSDIVRLQEQVDALALALDQLLQQRTSCENQTTNT